MLTTVSAIIVSESVRMISVISGVGGRGNNHDGAAVGGGGISNTAIQRAERGLS